MAKENKTDILEFFEKHPDVTYEFLTILDTDIKNRPYYCIAVFKQENSYWTENVLMPPELLRQKYKVGYFYKNGKRVFKRTSVKKDLVTIETSMNDKLYQMGSLFNDYFVFPEINKDYFKKYFDRQWAYKIEKEDYILIIPCYTISSRFYFMSSSMKNAVMAGSLSELHYRYYPVVNDEVKVHIKKKAGKKDLPFLCRFLTNKVAKERFEYFFKQVGYSKYDYISLKSYFPVNEIFNIAIEYKELDYKIDNKPVRLVVNIVNDTSSLGFSKLNYKQFTSSVSPEEVSAAEFPLPSKNKFKKRRRFGNDKVIRQGTPSSDNYKEMIFEKSEQDLNTLGLEINGENIYMPTVGQLEIENIDKKGSKSFEPSKSSGDEKLFQSEYMECDADSESKVFKLEDFVEFYEALMQRFGVEEVDELAVYEVPKVYNKSRNTINSKSVSLLTGNARRYLSSTFLYDNRCVYIVEIEHDTWTPSTWFFISQECDIDEKEINNILEAFIQKSLNYTDFAKYLAEEYSLKFIHHNHKKGDVDDLAIDSWCDNLLEKIYIENRN
ncbi:Tn7-like element transposition protein TnsE [Sulfurimonas sp. SWIR-19]|uniref:Tn7-like element transposition protein TnsE n=1 Tax=Sulfurimonas sp. SWIR-19 TaxID=2878390 RepID=UPI001CF4A7CF|nr:Tn7-like element transposition protein TnsE [Sulfurimonas sp. SWIR-19]UCM99809.1 Tn7-like element transposition protein TnsE [Sulfurimonas sp. SWIR-19]